MNIRNDVLKFECIYQQDGVVRDNYRWSGYVERTDSSYVIHNEKLGVSSLEGVIIDNQFNRMVLTEIVTNKQYIEDYKDRRILFGQHGMNYSAESIKFVIFPLYYKPIDYEFMYDEEDNCYYGVWYWVNKKINNIDYNGFAKLYIQQCVDVKSEDIYEEIARTEALYKYADDLDELLDSGKSNMQQHDEVNMQRFIDAKNYFRKINMEKNQSSKRLSKK